MKVLSQKSIFILVSTFFLSSCSILGINFKHKTPKKADKYPVFTESDSLFGNLSPLRSAFDVHFYDLSVEFNTQKIGIKGAVEIHFEAKEDFEKIQIDLHEDLIIDSIIFNGETLSFSRKERAVFVSFQEKLQKGTKDKFTVAYHGSPIKAKRPPWDGGFVYEKDENKNPWLGVACEKIGASIWWPLKDHLSDEPDSMKLHYTIPQGLFCVGNGSFQGSEVKDGKETFHWDINYPINSYNVTFYIGDFERFTIPYQKDENSPERELEFYVLKPNVAKAREHFKESADVIAFFEEIYGEYPYWKDGYKLIESPFEGMEHQTAIAYGNGYKKHRLGFDYIILHETAHEWWGNSLSIEDFAHIWLHEGFATYSEALYVERTYGHQEYIDYLRFYAIMIKNKKSVVGPEDVNHWDYKDGDPYVKGALTLHTLRNCMFDDDLFMDILKTFYQEHKYSSATTQDFIDLVNKKTERDFTWLFDQYLFKRESPQLEYKFYMAEDGKYYLNYRWNHVGENFNVPVKFTYGASMFITTQMTIYPSLVTQQIEIPGAAPSIYKMNLDASYMELHKNKKLIYVE